MDAKKYNNIKLAISIGKGLLSFALIFFFIVSGYSVELEEYLRLYSENNYILLLLFVVAVGIAGGIVFLPLNFYSGFILEHKFKLSNQNFGAWLWENFKGTIVGSVIALPILLIFYYVLVTFGELWWLPFAIALFLFSVILAQLVPVVILPLFYKVIPLEDEELKNRIINLSKNAGLKVENVFKFDMSKNTRKANAAFTGLGKTKRILLGDTLLADYSNDEIETVIAHELGHYKKKHIIKNLFIGTAFSFLTLFIIAVLYDASLTWFNFMDREQIAALPLLALWSMIIGLVQTPISNYISRKFEYEADDYAISSTGKYDDFINTLNKITDQNLGDREPHPLVEWYSYSHPSIKKRVDHILSLKNS